MFDVFCISASTFTFHPSSLLLTFFLLLLFPFSSARAAEWLFMPLGSSDTPSVVGLSPADIAEGQPLPGSPAPGDDAVPPVRVWSRAGFPHSGFDRLNPGRDVYGCYACVFECPAPALGRDLVLYLGVIDDADIAYVNGVEIGSTGGYSEKGSAWNRDREYRIPAELVKPGDNLIVVRVYDKWGLGGIMGPPALGVRIPEKWGSAPDPAGGSAAPPNPQEKLGRERPAERDSRLDQALPHAPREQFLRHFRLSFDLTANLREALTPHGLTGPVLDLGLLYDAAEVTLNGRLVGRLGRLPDRDDAGGAFLQTAKRLRCILPAGQLSETGNVLNLKAYRAGSGPPLPFTPMLVLPGSEGWSVPRMRSAAADLEHADLLVQSLDPAGAQKRLETVLDSLSRPSPGDSTSISPESLLRSRALSTLIYTEYLQAVDSRLRFVPFFSPSRRGFRACLRQLNRLLEDHWAASVSQDAMQSVCDILRRADGLGRAEPDRAVMRLVHRELPRFDTAVRYLGQDRTTRGDWPMEYGREGYVLAAMGQVDDRRGGPEPIRYALSLPCGHDDTPRLWTWSGTARTADPRALLLPLIWRRELAAHPPPSPEAFLRPLLPEVPVRRAAWWDDHGEQHAFDELGPDLLVHVDVPAGEHMLSFYCLDFDWYRTRHPRQQSVLIVDEEHRVLNAAWTGTFGDGVYERFAVTGPLRLTARFFKHRSACVAVSGVFLDPLPDRETGTDIPGLAGDIRAAATPDDLVALLDALAQNRTPVRLGYAVLARLFEMTDSWLKGPELHVHALVRRAGAYPCYSPAARWLRNALTVSAPASNEGEGTERAHRSTSAEGVDHDADTE